MEQDEWGGRRQVFGRAVDVYDRIRPSYPAEAVSWCLGDPDGSLTVVDLGAGTGKLTAVLLGLGHRVIAVEPDPAMLARLAANLDDHDMLTCRPGAAEELPLEDEEVDAVIAGQAFHWFNPDAVGPELGRVVRPGGVAAALWNSRDEAVDWVAAWSQIVEERAHPTGRKAMLSGEGPSFGVAFEPVEEATFSHHQVMAPDDLVRLAASRSYTIALEAPQRNELLAAVAELAATHPALAGRDTVELPYLVECYRGRHR